MPGTRRPLVRFDPWNHRVESVTGGVGGVFEVGVAVGDSLPSAFPKRDKICELGSVYPR